jgi:hypothetical protein
MNGADAPELESIAADAQRDRFADLLWRSGLTAEQHAWSSVLRRSGLSLRRFGGPRRTTTT